MCTKADFHSFHIASVKLLFSLNSITNRLLILGMTLLLMGAAGRVFFLSDYLRNDLTELASVQLLTMANYVAKNIDHDILERRELLIRVATKIPQNFLYNNKQMQAWLAERYDINPLFSQGLVVLDVSGNVLADYPALPGRLGRSFADRDYFQQALQGAFAIGSPVNGRIANVPVLPMAIPIQDKAGKVLAVLVGASALHSPNFLDTLYSSRIGNAGGLVLVSPRDKLFIGASDADIALSPTFPEGQHPQHDLAMKGFRGTGIDNQNGVEELTAIASIPSSGWFIVARQPTSEVFAPIARLHRFIESNTLMLVPFFFVFMVLGLRYLLHPLINAALHADKMTREEIPLEPLPVVRDDEVGHLTKAFNRVLSKLLESRAELQHMAHHDPLTGLPNRQLLADRLQQALAHLQRNNGNLAVLFLDLDGFKPINDQLGHEAGDAALREVASRLRAAVRAEDTLARVGGDEFVILLSSLNDHAKESAELVARKCLEVFQQPFVTQGRACHLGTSIGIAIGNGGCSSDELLITADRAMYQAKNSGRGKFFLAEGCLACLSKERQSCEIPIAKQD